MRMRKKKHGAERIEACASLLIKDAVASKPLSDYFSGDDFEGFALEIGCGKGTFACGTAAANPNLGVIAMEKVSDVACVALEKAMSRSAERSSDNIRFIIGDARMLGDYFPEKSFDCIYLNFSDPWPKKGYAKRRLTHIDFLNIYKKLLRDGGILKLKTDNEGLFDFSIEQFTLASGEILMSTRDLYSALPEDNIATEYETNFTAQGLPIYSAVVRF